MNIREALLGAKLNSEQYKIKQLGVEVTIREMNAAALEKFESSVVSSDDKGNPVVSNDASMAALIVSCVFDSKGNQMFTHDDIDQLKEAKGSIIKPLAEACARISGIIGMADAEKN